MTVAVPQDVLTVGRNNESTRIAWLEKTLAAIPAGARILDAGAGEQQFKRFCTHLKYVSQDFAQYFPEKDPSGIHTPKWDYGKLDHVCDITAIPEKNAAFDAIMCTEVFEHIVNPASAVKEFSRLLRPSGTLIITAPFCSLTHFAPHHYATGLSKFWYQRVLSENGFHVAEITPNGNWFEYLAQEIRRTRDVSQRYAGMLPDADEKEAMKRILGFLQRCSETDEGSSELLCFGYHVRAIRESTK